ncbi:MAG: recombinase family protein [Defluviitaleaceae bacterium]|nr:recombinase family protein [Defluviitaleaceae bacterium]MCL2275526.1 recombinase family protein [Defluviitaleaceae bacterium]
MRIAAGIFFVAGIYADGASGTSVRKCKEFQRMMHDARTGKFDMIITKDASRFSRNRVEGLLFPLYHVKG